MTVLPTIPTVAPPYTSDPKKPYWVAPASTPPPPAEGVWVTWDGNDYGVVGTIWSIWPTEVEALRYAVQNSEQVSYIPWGEVRDYL